MGRFLDISDYNNVNNYGAVAGAGLSVICKASEGTTNQESSFNDKYNNLKSVGVKVGAYHMLCVTSQPETQAQNFANQLSGKQLDIYPVLDVEYDNLRGCAEDYSNRFIAKFKELTGMDMIVYSCESYINDCFSDAFKNSHALWVANYSNNPVNRMQNVIAWQFTESCGDYGFVDGDVDCNELFDEGRFFINSTPKANVTYSAHVEDIGWQDTKRNGETAGTTGESKRIEGLTIDYDGEGHLEFQCHVQDLGWQSCRQGGEIGGTVGKCKRIEAVAIALKDTNNHVTYRVHVEDIGWQDWTKDGEIAGTVGESKRLEAIEIKII